MKPTSNSIAAKKIIDLLTSRPVAKDKDGYFDMLADEKQMIDIVENYLSKQNNQMREVIRIPQEQQTEKEKPVEFTHILEIDNGWEDYDGLEFEKVVYLGECTVDGDMFAGYSGFGNIYTLKGHLNSGKY